MDYTIEIPYKVFIENYFLRSALFRVLSIDDPLVPQLKLAIEKQLIPLIHLQLLPAGDIHKDDFFDGQPLKDETGQIIKRNKDIYKVWYKTDYELSFRKWDEAKKAGDAREKIYWANKERLGKLVPCIMKATMLEEADATKIAKNIIEKNIVFLEEDFLKKGGS